MASTSDLPSPGHLSMEDYGDKGHELEDGIYKPLSFSSLTNLWEQIREDYQNILRTIRAHLAAQELELWLWEIW